MGVTNRRGIHVLVVAGEGVALVRLVVEAEVGRRGWVQAWSPADADVLVVCGRLTGWFAEAADRLWAQLPGPRARVDLVSADAVASRLGDAVAVLRDRSAQEDLAQAAELASSDLVGKGEGEGSSGEHAHGDMGMDPGMDMGSDDGMDVGADQGMGMGTGQGMDMGTEGDMGMDMDMSGPAGIPLAQGSDDDRDGLEMDVSHMMLGPGLLGWPAGLALQVELHGDVVTALDTIESPSSPTVETTSSEAAALMLDAAAAVLQLTGWRAAAERARRACFQVLEGDDLTTRAGDVEALARAVGRSRFLRWSLEGMRRSEESVSAGGTVRLRLLRLLEEAAGMLRAPARAVVVSYGLDEIDRLAIGQDLGTLRLLVACLALHVPTLATA